MGLPRESFKYLIIEIGLYAQISEDIPAIHHQIGRAHV